MPTSANRIIDKFKLMETQDDGSLVAKTFAELGITSIDLTVDTTNIELPDGPVITGQTTFTMLMAPRAPRAMSR